MTVSPSRPRRTGVWLLTALAIGASLAFVAFRLAGASDGAVVPFYADAWSADGVRVAIDGSSSGGGLAAGDVVTAVAGRPLAVWLDGVLDPGLGRSGLEPGAPVLYTVRRDGAIAEVPVVLGPRDISGTLAANWSVLVFTLVLQLVATYVLVRRPEASAAVALTVAAVGVTGSTLPWMLGTQVSDIIQGWPFLLYGLTAGGLYMLLWPAGALHLPLAMASGSTGPGRRSLALAYGLPLGGYVLGMAVARLLAPSSPAWLATWSTVQLLVIVPTVLAGVLLTVRGYRAAAPALREQVRWAAIGGVAATIPSLLLILGPELLTGRPLVPWSAVGLLALPLPLGVAAGILRYRLFDIEVVVNRALVYGGATISIVAIYAVTVSVLGALLPLGGGFPASLLATGLAAIVALPIRDRLQRTVNRVMYGDRDDPYRALARLGRRLEGALDPVEAPQVIVRAVAESLRLPWVALRVWRAADPGRTEPGRTGEGRTVAFGRQPAGAVTAVPLAYGAEVLGELLVAPRSATEPLTAADRTLLEALARQAGAAIHAFGLTLDLVESRERLVAAREEERRRIRRDLHDGLGPTLAAIGMRAEVAEDLVAKDADAAREQLGQLRAEVHAALGDIRRLVDALRPPALDELGLIGALQAQADRLGPEPNLEIVASGALPELPAAVEVAAYRIAVEAMTNAARHAGARRCRVRLAVTGAVGDPARALEVEVTDDGRGLPAGVRPGIGLLSMRERAAEVGGSCELGPAPGGGARVVARLPLEALAAADGGHT